MIEITLCPKVLEGDIPTYTFNKLTTAKKEVKDWIYSKNTQQSVFACFINYSGDDVKYRDEQDTIIVTHCNTELDFFSDERIDECWGINELELNKDKIKARLAIFEFEDYQEAFGYCADLKESF